VLLGDDARRGLGGSEYQAMKAKALGGPAPAIDLDAERRLQQLVLELARAHVLSSAHDVADGGFAVALAECAATMPGAPIGAEVAIDAAGAGPTIAGALFGEAPSRVIVSLPTSAVADVLARAAKAGVPARAIGQTGGDRLRISVRGENAAERAFLDVPVDKLRAARESCFRPIVGE
jgi:phosphoribosylformylglycinamidine synthase